MMFDTYKKLKIRGVHTLSFNSPVPAQLGQSGVQVVKNTSSNIKDAEKTEKSQRQGQGRSE